MTRRRRPATCTAADIDLQSQIVTSLEQPGRDRHRRPRADVGRRLLRGRRRLPAPASPPATLAGDRRPGSLVAAASLTATARLATAATIALGTAASLTIQVDLVAAAPRIPFSTAGLAGLALRREHRDRRRRDPRGRVRRHGVSIRDVLNDAPNTCSLTLEGDPPAVGQALRHDARASRRRAALCRHHPDRRSALRPAAAAARLGPDRDRRYRPRQCQAPVWHLGRDQRQRDRPGHHRRSSRRCRRPASRPTCRPSRSPSTAATRSSPPWCAWPMRSAATPRSKTASIYLFHVDTAEAPDPLDAAHPPLD